MIIDTLTSLIPLVCEQLAGRPHTLNLIKDILRNSNRSLPEITISEHATNIFLTLCKHPASSSAIFDQDDLIDLLLQVSLNHLLIVILNKLNIVFIAFRIY